MSLRLFFFFYVHTHQRCKKDLLFFTWMLARLDGTKMHRIVSTFFTIHSQRNTTMMETHTHNLSFLSIWSFVIRFRFNYAKVSVPCVSHVVVDTDATKKSPRLSNFKIRYLCVQTSTKRFWRTHKESEQHTLEVYNNIHGKRRFTNQDR